MACLHANAGEQEPYSQPVGHLQLPCTQPCSAQALLPLLLFLYELLALWGPAVVLSWSRKVAFAEWSDELPLFLVVRSCSRHDCWLRIVAAECLDYLPRIKLLLEGLLVGLMCILELA
ncbi:uncharacterized protein [Drosophila virilis]|uniref:uncharacterized protein n=1 Tax=Drosophila virilis TaxID=7244 RepID=UPI001396334C|nr:uncharacterized protein LOC116650057 isoform X1 [Drosophila virilis]